METYAPSTRATADTSIESYYTLNAGEQRQRVMSVIKRGAVTDRDVARELIITPSTVSARRAELIKQGRVRVAGKKIDPMTGKRVTLWEEVPSEPYQRMLGLVR